jgi:two-component system response regulator protein BraR/BceR
MYKILIVEDDRVIGEQTANHLHSWGFDTLIPSDFSDIMATFTDYEPHLILLDISLPFYNGYHWCEEIRRISNTPIIFISSSSEDMNMVMAMNMGADDFIAKPFDINVLIAKVRALLRRTYNYSENTEGRYLDHDGILLNLGDASLMIGNEKLELTKNEFRIMEILFNHRGTIVSRDELMVKLWETDSFVDENTLTVNITRLRKKLEENGIKDLIKTKKGLGYFVH